MTPYFRASASCLALAFVLPAAPALAADDADAPTATIVVTGAQRDTVENAPSTTVSIDATRIAQTVNAVNTEDTLKYLPSLLVRKRHIGDTQAPLATRTSGVGASARSLIYADGVLLSALIGNNNSTASPRWGLVAPQEIAKIDVLYGPFSAAYPGNSIGAVVDISTRLPDRLEASVQGGVNIQRFDQYASRATLPSTSIGATLGDRFGRLAFFASAAHIVSNGQPLAYVTAARPATPRVGGIVVTGAFDDLNRSGAPVVVIGAGGIEHQVQDMLKLKLAFDVTPRLRLTYIAGLFLNATDATAESYLRDANGTPVYAGTLNIGGYPYMIAASAFSNNVYRMDERHWSHSLTATGQSPRFDWQFVASRYVYDKDVQRIPAAALPGAVSGGTGSIVRLDGTGWWTLDAKGSWRSDAATHAIGFGAHFDRFELNNVRAVTSDWLSGQDGSAATISRGKTETLGLWAQDKWQIAPPLALTIGGRYERWRAFGGYNYSAAPALSAVQPTLSASRVSPKASLTWQPDKAWSVTASFGAAWRFPTVTELYQAVTTGPAITVPNPTLRPEHALSEELAIKRGDARGYVRLSLFHEVIDDALLSQAAPLVPGSATLFSYIQNVERVRSRGVELAFEQRDLLVAGFDLVGSFTFVDSRVRADTAFAPAVGKQAPQVPRTKATLVATWRPDPTVSVTAAVRYSARSFGTIDNSDPVSHTSQGFDGYVVADLRATIRAGSHWVFGLGVDNVANDKYYLFHPFPQRSLVFDAKWTW